MVQLPPGLREVIGTDGPDEFRGRPQTAFFGRAGSDLFRAAGLEGVQFFLGGSNADRYVASSGTYVVIGETAGANDVLRAPGVSLNGPNTGLAEVDGRHLVVVDIGSDTVVWLLDWLDPARQVETFELGDGTFRFGDEITAASIRASANYEAFSMRDLFGDEAAAVRATFDALLARADELEGEFATPGPDVLTGTPGDDRIEGRGATTCCAALPATICCWADRATTIWAVAPATMSSTAAPAPIAWRAARATIRSGSTSPATRWSSRRTAAEIWSRAASISCCRTRSRSCC
jgi:hypothetical protein